MNKMLEPNMNFTSQQCVYRLAQVDSLIKVTKSTDAFINQFNGKNELNKQQPKNLLRIKSEKKLNTMVISIFRD